MITIDQLKDVKERTAALERYSKFGRGYEGALREDRYTEDSPLQVQRVCSHSRTREKREKRLKAMRVCQLGTPSSFSLKDKILGR